MALPASSVVASTPKFQIRPFKNKPYQLHRWAFFCTSSRLSPSCSMKTRNSLFGEQSKIKLQMSIAEKRLWEATPKLLKELPWRKAGTLLLKRLLFIGQMTLKWSLITLFICSSISDVIFSVSTNQELIIPFGLLIGCLMTEFLNETLREMFKTLQEKGLNMPLVVISCCFVLVKVASTFFAARTQVLLLHVANGGLLQVLWLWRNLSTEVDKHYKDKVFTRQDASLAADAEE